MTIARLRANGRVSPLEVDDPRPRFTWHLLRPLPAGHIQVSVALADGSRPDLDWTSATLQPDAVSVVYTGSPLLPASSYRWSVEAISEQWTDVNESVFGTGLQSSWSADWIGREPTLWFGDDGELADRRVPTPLPHSWQTIYSDAPLQLRRSFTIEHRPIRAVLFATSHGIYHASINGRRVGADELTPGWTDYARTIEYQGYDVTEMLAVGENTITGKVADGWWSGFVGYHTRSQAELYGDRLEFLAELHLDYPDGTRRIITSDSQWRELPGELVMSDLQMGEFRDSAMATEGWELPGFDDSGWRPVHVRARDDVILRGQLADPVRVIAELSPTSIIETLRGSVLVDFVQNVSGRIRLRADTVERGDVLVLRHGERMAGDTVYTSNLRSAEARDIIVSDGAGQWVEPEFTCHGFQFVEIAGLRAPLRPDDIRAIVLSSVAERTGTIRASTPLVEQIVSNVWWSQVSNFVAVPTDCPQRDERLGWTADVQVFAPTAFFNADVQQFVERWVDELESAQDSSGRVPDVAPVPPSTRNFDVGAPGWGDAIVLVPWQLYRTYGDENSLRRRLPAMRRWVDYVARSNDGGPWIVNLGNNYGDWLSVDAETPRRVVAAAYQIRSATVLADALDVVGQTADAMFYRVYASKLRRQFDRELVDADGHVLGRTQSGYLFALAWDLVPPSKRPMLGSHLVADIEGRGRKLTTGFLGVGLLGPVLSSLGRGDLAIDLLLQTEYPSWGYSIDQGATTIWERWDGWTAHAGFQAIEMNSFNHYSLGSVVEWLYEGVAGIRQPVGSVGYRRVIIEPLMDARLRRFAASFETVRGTISIRWDLDAGWVETKVPATTDASLILDGTVLEVAPGVTVWKLDSSSAPTRN